MSCAITQGYTLDCRDNVGGVKTIYITDLANITGFSPANSSGTISSISMSTGTQFYAFNLEKETSDLTENITTNDVNGTVYYEQDVAFTIRKMQATWRNELKIHAQDRLAMVVLDRNGKYWAVGFYNGLEMQKSDAKTGKNMGDFNGYDLKYKAKEEQPMQEVSSSIIAGLTVAH